MKYSVYTLVAIVCLGFFLRVHGINYYSYGDEHFHVYNSLGLASGQLPGNFHRVALFLFYGFFYAVGWVIGIFRSPSEFIGIYFSDRHVFYYSGRLFESLAGTAGIPLMYLLGKKMFSRTTGLVAALFLAVSPPAVEISQIARGQALCLFLILVSIYFACLATDKKNKWACFLVSGLCFGAAYSIRIFAGVALIPVMYFYVISVIRRPGSVRVTPGYSGFPGILIRRGGLLFNAGLWAFIFGGAIALLVSAPRLFLSYPASVARSISVISVGSDQTPVMIGAYRESSLRYYLFTGLPIILGYPLYIFTGIAFLVGLFRYKRRHYILLILTSVLYLLVMGRGSIAAARYFLPIFPLIFLVAGDTLVSGIGLIRTSESRRMTLCLGMACLLAVPMLRMTGERNRRNRMTTTKTLAEEWIFANFPDGTRIAVESMGYRGPDLKLIPVIDFWMYNMDEEELRKVYEERRREGYSSIALKYFIENPPSPRYYITSISIRQVIDIEQLKEEKYQYIVTCSFNRKVYQDEIIRERYPEHYQSRKLFYPWLEEEGELIKVFSPDAKTPGDEIRVYRVRGND